MPDEQNHCWICGSVENLSRVSVAASGGELQLSDIQEENGTAKPASVSVKGARIASKFECNKHAPSSNYLQD